MSFFMSAWSWVVHHHKQAGVTTTHFGYTYSSRSVAAGVDSAQVDQAQCWLSLHQNSSQIMVAAAMALVVVVAMEPVVEDMRWEPAAAVVAVAMELAEVRMLAQVVLVEHCSGPLAP